MGNKARTVRYFPNMKVRGASNRRKTGFRLMARTFDRLGHSAESAAKSLKAFADSVNKEEK